MFFISLHVQLYKYRFRFKIQEALFVQREIAMQQFQYKGGNVIQG